MPSTNILGAEKIALAASFGPTTVNTGAPGSTGVVNMKHFEQVTVTATVGAVNAGTDVVVTLTQGQGPGMTGAKTVRTETMSADASNTQLRFSVRSEQLDINNGFNHVRGDVTHGDATGGPISLTIDGTDGYYEPMNQWNVSSATSVVP